VLRILSDDKNSENTQVLVTFWNELSEVTQLTFVAKTQSDEEKGWNGKGDGPVTVIREDANTLIFHEKGIWKGKLSTELNFTNIFRWTRNLDSNLISLEHLRRGPGHPVFLFHLAPTNKLTLSSVDAHLCGRDTYFGQMHINDHHLRLSWKIIGPKKNEEIDYYYS
jgi:hypothetical protein